MTDFNNIARFQKPANQWTMDDFDAWGEIEYQQRLASGEIAREDAEGQAYAEQQNKERREQYESWKVELAELQSDEEGDECVDYRIKCLQADIFGYEEAKSAIERGDEEMAPNPYEAYLQHPL